MIGYVYLDTDLKLHRKDLAYIDTSDLGFWYNNSHMIIKYWKFDTDNRSCMVQILKDFRDLEVPTSIALLFLKDINFNIESLKVTNADSI